MSETPEQQPVAETQQPVAGERDYAAEVEMLKAQNHKVIGEKKAFQKQVEDMQRQLTDLQNNHFIIITRKCNLFWRLGEIHWC